MKLIELLKTTHEEISIMIDYKLYDANELDLNTLSHFMDREIEDISMSVEKDRLIVVLSQDM